MGCTRYPHDCGQLKNGRPRISKTLRQVLNVIQKNKDTFKIRSCISFGQSGDVAVRLPSVVSPLVELVLAQNYSLKSLICSVSSSIIFRRCSSSCRRDSATLGSTFVFSIASICSFRATRMSFKWLFVRGFFDFIHPSMMFFLGF